MIFKLWTRLKPILIVIGMLLTFNTARAEKQLIDGIYYNLDGVKKTAEVTFNTTKYNSYSGNIEIPKTVVYKEVTCTVTSIGDNAFRLCKDLASVTLPSTLTSIGKYAFFNCTSLTAIDIPNGVTSIGDYAFNASGITSIILPNSVTDLGVSAFSGCGSLKTITLSDNLTQIKKEAFRASLWHKPDINHDSRRCDFHRRLCVQFHQHFETRVLLPNKPSNDI